MERLKSKGRRGYPISFLRFDENLCLDLVYDVTDTNYKKTGTMPTTI